MINRHILIKFKMEFAPEPDAHPIFENEKIVKAILACLPEPDLRRCGRLINKLFNRLAIPQLKERATYIEIGPKQFSRVAIRAVQDVIERFNRTLAASPDFPYTKVELILCPQNPGQGQTWNTFFMNVAPILKELKISKAIHDMQMYIPVVGNWIKFSHLTRLTLGDVVTDRILEIVERSPKLSYLTLERVENRALRQLSEIRALKLKRLSLQYSVHTVTDAHCFADFLEGQQATLEHLTIYQVKFAGPVSLALQLNQLKTLQIMESARGFGETWSYSAKFPALKQLVLEDFRESEAESYFLSENPSASPTVQELHFNLEHKSEDSQVRFFTKCPIMFPNLRKLGVDVSFEHLLPLLEKLEHIKELTLFQSNMNIKKVALLLTGWTLETFEDNARRWRFKERAAEIAAGFAARVEDEKPYSSLKKLKVLELHIFAHYPIPWTEATCRLVFLQLPNLKRLHLKSGQNVGKPRIMEDLMKEMKSKFLVLFDDSITEYV